MLIPIFAFQAAIFVLLIILLTRKSAPAQTDPRLAQLPDAIARLEGQAGTTNKNLNDSLSSMRMEASESAQQMRTALNERLDALTQRLVESASEGARQQTELRESLNQKFSDLSTSNAQSLAKMSQDNEKKLEQMRETVDEKLQKTLQTRLTESFGAVTDQLTKVHSGLGEMSKLSDGVQGLNRVFSNVKSRGGFAEVQLGRLLEDILAPGQFQKNVTVKPGSREVVEYAVKFPSQSGDTLMPIDAKFPREDWERLESAYESGDAEQIKSLGRAFENAIRTQGKKICDLYIAPPVTTPHAIMFLPTEGLYAEVMRRDGLQASIQADCHVTIAGPSTLSAILTSFQMGFHMLAIQQKGDEVWKVLASTRTEFGKFGEMMGKMEQQVGTVQNTIQKLGVRTRAINRTLSDVASTDAPDVPALPGFEEIAGIAPALAAADEEDE